MQTTKCPCGNVFDSDKAPIRNAKDQPGEFLNEAVRNHSTTGSGSRYEHQCPKCKLWFDAVMDAITEQECKVYEAEL